MVFKAWLQKKREQVQGNEKFSEQSRLEDMNSRSKQSFFMKNKFIHI